MKRQSLITKEDALTDTILESLKTSETQYLFRPPARKDDHNPRQIYLQDSSGKIEEVWLYAWYVNEYSEIRSDPSPPVILKVRQSLEDIILNTGGPTVLLGYDSSRQIFVGLDVERYIQTCPGISDVQIHAPRQINPELLEEARINGVSFRREPSGEIIVGLRPDHVGPYLHAVKDLHFEGRNDETFQVLEKIGRGLWHDVDEKFPKNSPAWLMSFAHVNSKSTFKDRVRNAYGRRCVLSGIQLGLLDSAHIYSKKPKDTSHQVCNGFLLQPTLHRAHDHALIYLVLGKDGTYSFHPNELALKNTALDWGRDGLAYISSFLKKPLPTVPKDQHLRPDIRWIRKSYTYYNITLMSHLFWTDEDEEKWQRERSLTT